MTISAKVEATTLWDGFSTNSTESTAALHFWNGNSPRTWKGQTTSSPSKWIHNPKQDKDFSEYYTKTNRGGAELVEEPKHGDGVRDSEARISVFPLPKAFFCNIFTLYLRERHFRRSVQRTDEETLERDVYCSKWITEEGGWAAGFVNIENFMGWETKAESEMAVGLGLQVTVRFLCWIWKWSPLLYFTAAFALIGSGRVISGLVESRSLLYDFSHKDIHLLSYQISPLVP